MENSRSRYLIKNTLIFTVGNIGSKIISFFLIPLYTNVLTTAQYGVTDLVTTIVTVAVPILTLNICESVMRFGLDKNSNRERNIQIGTLVFVIGMTVGLSIIPFCNSFDQISEYSVYIYFYVFTFAASQLYLCDLRGKELLLAYSVGSILQTFCIAAFNIIFLVVLNLGIKGYLLAYIFANGLVSLYAILAGNSYRSLSFNKLDIAAIKSMVKYSVVLIPNSFMWWIINSSDRIMVTAMIGASANGIYAVSYKIPTLMSVFTSIFNQAWGYSAIKENGAKDEQEYNNKVLRMLISFTMLTAIGLLTITKPFLSVYVSKDYYVAWKYVPFLLIGSVYMTFGTFFASSYTVHKDSFGYLFSGSFGAIFNASLNCILIPLVGVSGAAIATCISYIMVFVFRLVHTRKYLKYDICNKEFVLGSILLLVDATGLYFETRAGIAIQWITLVVAFFLYGYSLLPILLETKSKLIKKDENKTR